MLHILFLETKRSLLGTKYIAEFDITNDCNLRCKHCYHFRFDKNPKHDEISVNQWRNKFKELRKQGVRRILLIGGEPTLRMDIIEEASKHFKYIDICSNGTIKIDERLKKLKIFISIDGTKEHNDSIRGAGTFDKVLQNYRGDKRVVLSMTITQANWQYLEYVVKLSIENGNLGVSCDVYTPSPHIREKDILYVTPDVRKKVINEFRHIKKEYPSYFLMSNSAIKWFEFPDHKTHACYWNQAVLHFDAEMNKRISCKDLDCCNCGHFAQANLSPLNFLIKKRY